MKVLAISAGGTFVTTNLTSAELEFRDFITFFPINDLADVFRDPHVLAREMRLDLPHPTAGHVSVPGSALKMRGTPVEYRMPPPLLGEHTEAVLGELAALSADELAELRRKHIV